MRRDESMVIQKNHTFVWWFPCPVMRWIEALITLSTQYSFSHCKDLVLVRNNDGEFHCVGSPNCCPFWLDRLLLFFCRMRFLTRRVLRPQRCFLHLVPIRYWWSSILLPTIRSCHFCWLSYTFDAVLANLMARAECWFEDDDEFAVTIYYYQFRILFNDEVLNSKWKDIRRKPFSHNCFHDDATSPVCITTSEEESNICCQT